MSCFWLSFCDPNANEFIGATVVKADSIEQAVASVRNNRDVDPGCDATFMSLKVPSDAAGEFDWALDRFVPKKELEARGVAEVCEAAMRASLCSCCGKPMMGPGHCARSEELFYP